MSDTTILVIVLGLCLLELAVEVITYRVTGETWLDAFDDLQGRPH